MIENPKKLYDLLPKGNENAVSLKDISARLGINERSMKTHILHARLKGYMICSLFAEKKGYFKPSDTKEALKCYRIFHRRAETSKAVLEEMKRYLIKNGINPDEIEKEGENNV